ncbi:MAG: Bro-N domain-containing protein [Prosthecobacter sp.]|nr:Bro-N domain-containing protein [Prosthecobacter sp.]
MYTALQTFTFAGTHHVRTVLEDGQVKFVACDVCVVLDLDNTSKMLKNLDEDEKGITIGDTLVGTQTMVTITEPGLCRGSTATCPPSM